MNKISDIFNKIATKLFGSSTYVIEKGKPSQEYMSGGILNRTNPRPQEEYVPQQQPASRPTPAPAIQQQPVEQKNQQDYTDYIRSGLEKYSGGQAGGKSLPIEKYIPTFNEAAQEYEIFAKYPWLLPAISILESSGGLNVTRKNNPLNWAARIQKQGGYEPSSWDESINDAITAIAGDYEARPEGTARGRNADYYEPFRESGDIKTFADIYEPANGAYYRYLMDLKDLFGEI